MTSSKIFSLGILTSSFLFAVILSLVGCNESVTEAARREGRIVIYSSTDEPFVDDVIASFERANPQIKIEYHALKATEVNQRYLSEAAANRPTADLLINSAMDLQIKLANDGHARTYMPPQPEFLPVWASWNKRAYALSVEPIVIGFDKRLITAQALGSSRSDLAAYFKEKSSKLHGKIGLYDPEISSLGMLLVNQDIRIDQENWALIATLGRHSPRLYASTSDMINDISRGKLLFGYNMIGSYALRQAKRDPNFGVIIPQDYTLLMSRVAILPRESAHPNAATLLMDFLLSQKGQKLIADRGMVPVRTDVDQPYPELARSNIRAVRVGPALLANLDTMNRSRFLKQWKSTILVDSQIEQSTRPNVE